MTLTTHAILEPRHLAWHAWVALALGMVLHSASPASPLAAVRNVQDTYHGVRVNDPYRYMEDVRQPQVREWLNAQGQAARRTLDRIEGREALAARLEQLNTASGDTIGTIVRTAQDRWFYLRRNAGERQFKLVTRQGKTGTETVLVDPQQLADSRGIPHAINYFVPSWDGRHVAYGLSAGGSEDASLHVMNVATRRPVGRPVPRVPDGLIGWLPDSQSLTYNQLQPLGPGAPQTEVYLDSRVMWQRLGQSASQARPVFGPTVTRHLGLDRLDIASLAFAPDSPWMVARTTDSTRPEGYVFVAPRADLRQKRVRWTRISSFQDQITQVELKGHQLYLLSHAGAPRYQVLRLDLRHGELARAEVVARPLADTVLERFTLTRDGLLAQLREGTSITLRRYRSGDTAGEALPLPYPGAARVHADPTQTFDDVLYTLAGWTEPPRLWALRASTSTDTGLLPPPTAADTPTIEVRDVLAPSHDGALVPMTLLYRKGLVLDGRNPTLLIGYAAYGFTQTARYAPSDLAWLERGGVLAFANGRGSGVYGQEWYRAGFKATKSNTWKDGIACAQYLIDQGYASPQTLAVMGGSAGGIFAGRSMTEAPQLFAAAVLNVGVMDAVRAEESANGITNVSEFGSAHRVEEFPAVLDMSTYHHITDGTAYPAVLLTHGMNDPRVEVWHSAKAAARLLAASSSGKPVLLRLDHQAGHGIGSTTAQRQSLTADIYSFLLWQMGQRGRMPE